ncbi:unnamed protein product [Bemisia tabaci]|uniref:limulus clotting factor C n=1 Tax=Bemisia tabaci TaxID=7038 RepID=A0A9P0AM12_BEMTA|nr:unnamed protein product [Bemisia tabaci]
MNASAWMLKLVISAILFLLTPPAQTFSDEDIETTINREIVEKLSSLPGQDICGTSRTIQGRIVGGMPAKLGDWPWAVGMGLTLKYNNAYRFACGAALISNRHLVTAAHCFKDFKEPSFQPKNQNFDTEGMAFRIGELVLNNTIDERATPKIYRPAKIAVHPRFGDDTTEGFDIAVITLDSEVQFTDLIRPICLPTRDFFFKDDFEGETVTVVGWGKRQDKRGAPSSNQLMQVQLPILSSVECLTLLQRIQIKFSPDGFCAYSENKDACQGDSGGPTMLYRDGKWYLYGVVSYGRGCARKEAPGVYNKVHTHLKFIVDSLG